MLNISSRLVFQTFFSETSHQVQEDEQKPTNRRKKNKK